MHSCWPHRSLPAPLAYSLPQCPLGTGKAIPANQVSSHWSHKYKSKLFHAREGGRGCQKGSRGTQIRLGDGVGFRKGKAPEQEGVSEARSSNGTSHLTGTHLYLCLSHISCLPPSSYPWVRVSLISCQVLQTSLDIAGGSHLYPFSTWQALHQLAMSRECTDCSAFS